MIKVNLDLKICELAKVLWVLDSDESNFVKGIGGVGDQLSYENLLFRIQGVDDDIH
jgi:hypothetical protein